jgi:hypothetical protein
MLLIGSPPARSVCGAGFSVIPALQQDADCRQRRQVDWGGDAQDVVAL